MDRRDFLELAGVGSAVAVAGCSELSTGDEGDDTGDGDATDGDATDGDATDGTGGDGTTRRGRVTAEAGPFRVRIDTPGVALGSVDDGAATDAVALVEARLDENHDGTLTNPTFSLRLDGARLRHLIAGDFSVDPTATETAAAGFDVEWEPGTTKSFAVTFVPTATDECTVEVSVSGDAGDVESGPVSTQIPVRDPGAPVTRGQLAGLARSRAAAATQYAATLDDTPGVGYDDQLRQALRGVTLSGAVMVGDAVIGTAAGAAGTAVDAVWEGLSQHVSPFEALVDFEPVGPGEGVDRERVQSEAYAPPFFSALLDQGQGILQRFERQLKTGGDVEYAAQKATVLLAAVADLASSEAEAWETGADDTAADLLRTQHALLDGTGIGDVENEDELFGPHVDRVDARLGEIGLDQVGPTSNDHLRQTLAPLVVSSTARRNFPETVQTAHSMHGFVTGEGRQIGHLRAALSDGLLTQSTETTPTTTTARPEATTLVDGFEDGDHEDRWEITKNQSDASAAVVSERAYRGDRSLRVHIGETYSGDYALQYGFDAPVQSGATFGCWCYPTDTDAKLVYDLRNDDERVMVQLSPFGDVRYNSSSTDQAIVFHDAYSAEEWQRIALVAQPDDGEAEARYVGPDETVRASAAVPAPSSYDRVRVFCGDYYGNVDVYLDEVTYAPAP